MKSIREIKDAIDAKAFELEWKAKRAAQSTLTWCADNKELVIAAIPVGLVLIKGVNNTIHSIDRKMDLRREQKLADMYIYDHSLGMKLKLQRPLKQSEKIEIDRRRHNGESKIQILANMGLLD